MPEYLAPGVFVEETSFRQKTIEGVSTSTTGFVGPTRFGPTEGEPALVTSFSEFERIYGGLDQLEFDSEEKTHNYLAHAVRAYFEEGGKRLYIARVFNERQASDGVASWPSTLSSPQEFSIEARYPGASGNLSLLIQIKVGPNILIEDPVSGDNTLQGTKNYDVVWVNTGSPSASGVYWVNHYYDHQQARKLIRLRDDDGPADQEPSAPVAISLDELSAARLLMVSVTVGPMGKFGDEQLWDDLTFHPLRQDSLSKVFNATPEKRSTELYVPIVFNHQNLNNGASIAEAILGQTSLHFSETSPRVRQSIRENLEEELYNNSNALTFQITLSGGDDGERPTIGEYEGEEDDPKSGLHAFEDLENISIVAAPGSSHSDNSNLSQQVIRALISHCERMRYRVAVLDSTNEHLPSEVQDVRGSIDSKHAALYYPWVKIADPVTETEIYVPPSGSLTGIFARNDVERGVHKAPANEVLRMAQGLEILINKSQQEILNPKGINCLRFFEGRGFRVWGARTITSDPEWKYLNVRRYFAYLERSIEKGTQWAVFENNGEVLWANIKSTIEDFLFNEWTNNHLAGTKPEQAYFVRCDRTTMTQNDIDNGRLVCLIGVAPLRPAEFVIFRIGQKTADSR